MNEESRFEIDRIRRECMELRADLDAMRKIVETLSVGGGKLGTAASIGESGGTDVAPQTGMFVPPTDADGVSLDEKEDEEGEEDDATGCLQIKGFAGKNKIDAEDLELDDTASDEEFLCRTTEGLQYRKLSASGGGGGGGGETGYHDFLNGFELVNAGESGSAPSWVLRISYATGRFADGLLVEVGDEQQIDIPVTLHSSIAQEDS